ncbi:MAG: PP2C family protein-serine/threonine phosphatase, partial [Sphingobacteriia bacterium]
HVLGLPQDSTMLLAGISIGLSFLLLRQGYHQLARLVIALAPILVASFSLARTSPLSLDVPPGIVLLLAFSLLPTLLFDAREWRYLALGVGVSAIFFLCFQYIRPYLVVAGLPDLKPQETNVILIITQILAFMVLAATIGQQIRLNYKAEIRIADLLLDTQDKNEELARSLDTIQQQAQDIRDSIVYAQRLQNAMLPGADELAELSVPLWVLNKPKEMIGGDFYWVARVDEAAYVALGDCTGHGVPGAMMTALGQSLLNLDIQTKHMKSLPQILEAMDQGIRRSLNQHVGGSGAADGMDLALLKLDLAERKVYFAGANRPLWVVKDGQITEVKATRRALGGPYQPDIPYEETVMPMEAADLLYLFSDGITDQTGGPQQRKYTATRLRSLITETLASLPAEAQRQAMEAELKQWMQTQEQLDDMLCIGIDLRTHTR